MNLPPLEEIGFHLVNPGRWLNRAESWPMLLDLLDFAVPMEIERLRYATFEQRLRIGLDGIEMLGACGEHLFYEDDYSPELFAILARGLAVLAYQPGGVRDFAGRSWVARSAAESEGEAWPEGEGRLSDWQHPDTTRKQRLLGFVRDSAQWTTFEELRVEYHFWGYSEARLHWDLHQLRSVHLIEFDGNNHRRCRPPAATCAPPPIVRAGPEAQAQITELQRKIPPRPPVPQTCQDFRRAARWWELEARRGYESSPRSRQYAANMRWAAERRRGGLVAPWDPVLDGKAWPKGEAP